jgi:PAS domain S-box-containing protein
MDVAVTPDEATEQGGNRACLEELEPSREAVGGSEAWFLTTFERAPIGIAHLDLDGRFLRVNRRFCEILGYTREEVLALSLPEIAHLDDLSIHLGHLSRLLNGQLDDYAAEKRHLRKDGSLVWARATVSLVRGPAGEPDYFLAIMEDISERKESEIRLRESEARYRSLFDDSPLPLWEEDFSEVKKYLDALRAAGVDDFKAYFNEHPETVRELASRVRIVNVNRAAVAMCDVESKEHLLAGLPSVFSEQSFDAFAEELAAIAEGKTFFELETSTRTLSGKDIYHILRWALAPGFEDTLEKVFVSITDITARKRAERALQESLAELERRVEERTAKIEEMAAASRMELAKLQVVIDSMAEGLVIADPKGDVLMVNPAARAIVGFETRQEVPKNLEAWEHLLEISDLAGRVLPHNEWPLRRALRGETFFNWDVRVRRKDTGRAWIASYNGGPVLDEQGQVVLGLVTIRDVTERLKAEERFKRLQAELAHVARLQTMGEMASGLAHELNQPLAAILMKAEVAAQKARLGKRTDKKALLEMLDFIADQAHRSGEIIRRMRQFVRKTEFERTPLDLREAISEVVSLMQSELDHGEVAVVKAVEPELPKVPADRIQIQQVLLNLVRNALDAMDQPGWGTRQLAIGAKSRPDAVEISVSDTGPGISEDRMAGLFSAFSSAKPGGMGLGLAISRTIVEAHGGHIWAARNPTMGMTFTFTLPIGEKDETRDQPGNSFRGG